jgi:uncharacterized membrane protein
MLGLKTLDRGKTRKSLRHFVTLSQSLRLSCVALASVHCSLMYFVCKSSCMHLMIVRTLLYVFFGQSFMLARKG